MRNVCKICQWLSESVEKIIFFFCFSLLIWWITLIGSNRSNNTVNTSNNQTFTPSSEPTYSENDFDEEFSNTPSLDISSDDLPFY